MIRVVDGPLYQWESGRKIEIELPEGITINEVHFAKEDEDIALVTKPYEEDGTLLANIPNIHLQTHTKIRVYLFCRDGENGRTIPDDGILTVIPRAKPDDYVYTETETLCYQALEERLKILEEGGTDGGMNKEQFQEAVNTALAQAKESGEFDGADGTTPHIGENGNWFIGDEDTGVSAEGKDGHTPVKGTDYFTEADKKEITEQAAKSVEIPQTLPNPNPLTFTGAVDAVYDGSTPITVEIPSSEGGVNVDAELREYYTTAKLNIRAAIESKGVAVNDEDSLNDYAGKIALIKTGSDLLDTNVYVADYSISEDIYMTAGVVDIWRRCLVS